MTVVKIKKQKAPKNVSQKENFENYEICLEANQLENKINYIEKMKLT